MNNPISISTGFAHRLTDDKNRMIEIASNFALDGVEIILPEPDGLFSFELAKGNIDRLKKFAYVSIHAPGHALSEDPISHRILDKISVIQKQVNAKNIIFHPTQIMDYGVFNQYNFSILLENEDWRKTVYKTPREFETLFKEHPSFGFNFDFAHALTVDPSIISDFCKFPNLQQVHLSFHDRRTKNHRFLFNNSSLKIVELIKLIPKEVPFVLECYAEDKTETILIEQEIKFLRGL